MMHSRFQRISLALFIFAALAGVFLTNSLWLPSLVKLLEDPEAFTGRAMIWLTMILALPNYWLLGMGYGSVWKVGESNKLTEYAPLYADWVVLNNQGHNGYLDIALSLGLFGLGLFVLSFFGHAFWKLLFQKNMRHAYFLVAVSYLVFSMMHNFLESTYLRTDNPFWLFLLIIILLLPKIVKKGRMNNDISI